MTENKHEDSAETRHRFTNQATDRIFREQLGSIFVSNASASSKVETFVRRQPGTAAAAKGTSCTISEDEHVGAFGPIEPDVDATAENIAEFTSREGIKQYVRHNGGFRAAFIRQRNSFSPLSISPFLFGALCQEMDVSPRFKDFLLYLGEKDTEIEIAPPPAWLKPMHAGEAKPLDLLEVMCGIRFVDLNARADADAPSSHWSLRQCAICCMQNLQKSTISWVLVTISPSVRQHLLRTWSAVDNPSHLSPLDNLCIIYETLVCNWRPYLVSLTTEVDEHTARSFGTSMDGMGPVQATGYSDLQALRALENKILAAKLAVTATRGDLASFLGRFAQPSTSLSKVVDLNVRDADAAFTYLIRDLDVNCIRLEQLLSRLRSTTEIVSVYMNLSNEIALQELSKESRYESQTMRQLNERMTELAEKNSEDSATVTVLTILTLIYLPITVVSNFFSTSFVGTRNETNQIYVTQDWWILFVTAVPLTAFTLYVWWVWSRIKASKTYPFWWPLRQGLSEDVSPATRLPRSHASEYVASTPDGPSRTVLRARPSWGTGVLTGDLG